MLTGNNELELNIASVLSGIEYWLSNAVLRDGVEVHDMRWDANKARFMVKIGQREVEVPLEIDLGSDTEPHSITCKINSCLHVPTCVKAKRCCASELRAAETQSKLTAPQAV